MRYADGFVIPVPKKNLKAYIKMAQKCAKIWMEYGALQLCECVSEDSKIKHCLPFPKAIKVKAGETVVFSWIIYKSRAHRDAVNTKIMKDPRIVAMMAGKEMPFDCKRMIYGGFELMVDV